MKKDKQLSQEEIRGLGLIASQMLYEYSKEKNVKVRQSAHVENLMMRFAAQQTAAKDERIKELEAVIQKIEAKVEEVALSGDINIRAEKTFLKFQSGLTFTLPKRSHIQRLMLLFATQETKIFNNRVKELETTVINYIKEYDLLKEQADKWLNGQAEAQVKCDDLTKELKHKDARIAELEKERDQAVDLLKRIDWGNGTSWREDYQKFISSREYKKP